MLLHSPDAESERLNKFGENRDAGTVGDKGGSGCHSDDNEDEDAPHSQDTEEGTVRVTGVMKRTTLSEAV